LYAATPARTPFWPVSVGQPPIAPRAEVGDELERVLATPPRRVATEIALTYPHRVPASAQRFLDAPAAALVDLGCEGFGSAS
jgi:hypothetical protein